MEIKIFYSNDWKDYELLDTGEGQKLERVGKFTYIRPYEDAVWPKSGEWKDIAGRFITSKENKKANLPRTERSSGSGWEFLNPEGKQAFYGAGKKGNERQVIEYKGIKFAVQPTPFRHFGFFPEQAPHWDFIEEKINLRYSVDKELDKKVKFLNLFGYTGVASLFALRAGAEVTHVDASKQSIDLAKENEKLSSLTGMRVIVDDAIKFLEREIKRGIKYDAIIMDPPKFGRGPKGEVWKLEENLPNLLSLISKVLSHNPLFVILTSYAVDTSSLALGYALENALKDRGGKVEQGELCIKEISNGRLVPLANTAVWS